MDKLTLIPKRVVCYCLITLSILMASLIKKDIDFSAFENRVMEYFHWPTIDTILSGEWFEVFEQYSLDQVICRDCLVEANSRGLYLAGKHQINGITAYTDGTLLQAEYDYPRAEIISDESISDTLIPLRDATVAYDGQFYYMNKYPRYLHFWDGFPYHEDEMVNSYLDANRISLQKLKDHGIRAVDTYANMMSNSDDYLFFYTDHHYTYKGAYYSYMALLDAINSDNPDRDFLSFPALDSMTMIKPSGSFWGSLIPQIGDRKYAGIDHLEYALPEDFPTEYERIESGEISDMPLIRSSPTTEYGWFMNGDYGNTIIKTNRPELPNILIIGYSYTDALELLAVYNFNEMHSIDPRQFDGDIREYISNIKCDYVVVQDMISLNTKD